MADINNNKCNACPCRDYCPLVCEPESLMCIAKRMNSNMTHRDESTQRYCPHCGRRID